MPGTLTNQQRRRLKQHIESNPGDTFQEFSNKYRGTKVSDAYYYMLRRQIHGSTGPRNANRKSLYLTVWSRPMEKVTDVAKNVLNDFVDTLNKTKRVRFQVIEIKDPAVLEVREISR